MVIIFFRAIILLIALIVVMRLMGKRQIGEMQPFEFIITLLIAELACVPMSDVSIPLVYGLVSVLAVFILHQLLTIFEQKFKPFRHLISGKPSVVINRDGVDIIELKRNNLGIDDLIESLRGTGNFTLDAVSYAIYEANGKLSVLKCENNSNYCDLPLLMISEGKIDDKNLNLCHMNKQFIDDLLKKENVKSLKNVEVLTIDSNGRCYLKENAKKYKILNIEMPKESNEW